MSKACVKNFRVLDKKVFELEHGQKICKVQGEIILQWIKRWKGKAPLWVMSNTCIKFQCPRLNMDFELDQCNKKITKFKGR